MLNVRNSYQNKLCLFIDRGILMTFGSGVHGSLGHGNHNDVVQAKIVEALIGFEVEQVRADLQQGGKGVGEAVLVQFVELPFANLPSD